VYLRRAVVAGTVTALLGSMLTLLAGSGQLVAPRPAPIAEAPDAPAAMAAARLQGSRVEVADERTPTRAVYANPGGTLTAELTPVPVRVQRGGRWVGVDTKVGRRADGLVAPKAADGDLTLSPGGDTPLATLRRDGKSLTLSWPGKLPAPELSGSQATYRGVFPGVDLVMIAERDGFRQHLVVRDAEAARNPALKTVKLALKADGLVVAADGTGALRAVDSAGAAVFGAPPSTMWDAAGRTAPIGVSVADGALVLTPDAKFLADPAVKYPVTVDPTLSTIQKWGWANVLSGHPDTPYWWTSGDGNAQVGQCPRDLPDSWCNGIGEGWAYFQYDTSFLSDKTLLSATFTSVAISSPDCSDRNQVVYRANGGIWNGMTWNNRQGGGWNRTRAVPGVHSGSCGTGWKPVGWDIPVDLIDRGAHTPLFLKAADSGDQYAWRKYDPAQTVLKVNWNRTPYAPGGIGTDPPLPAPCKFCGGVPYISQDSITLSAQLSDPDGDQLFPQWRVSADGTEIASWNGAVQGSGAVHTATIGLGDKDGKQIGWWVHGCDGATSSPAASGAPFVVDRTGVPRPPTVGSDLYTEDNRWHGGTDVPGTFTFGSNGVGDIDHYKYGWQDKPDTQVDADSLGGGTTVKLTPPGDGPQTLYVRSYDRAGNESEQREYRFYVRAGNGPLAKWAFDGTAQDSAFLGDRHGTLNNGATIQAGGALGSAVKLDGADDDVTAPNAVRTTAGFTVSAWVNLQRNNGARAVISQDGLKFPGFALWYRAENDGSDAHWTFGKSTSTDSWTSIAMAQTAAGVPQLNTWTHLAGVYDRDANEIRLFVDGKLAGTAAAPPATDNAGGPVRIGRLVWDGKIVDPWPGAVDEAQIFDRPLSATEVAGLVSAGNVQVAQWKFDEDKGTTARNAVEGGTDAVLQGGAAFVPDGAVGRGVHFDGVTGGATTTGPMVRTDQSFSVAAQVRLDAGADENGTFTVLSQDGEKICSFCLQYQGKKWVFVFPRSDGDTPSGYDWVGTQWQPARGQWYHLVGTYDAPSGKIRLYIDGELIGEAGRVTPWQATHAFRISGALVNGGLFQRLPGTVDDVRVYSRAISQDEVSALVSSAGVTAATWKFDGDATDANGRFGGTVAPGADWAAGQTNQPDPGDLALRLAGSGYASTSAPVVHTDRSFSVTAWARLDKIGAQAAVVSQSGAHVAGFDLRVLADGRWGFVAMKADQAQPGDEATGPVAQPGVWTHLAGVYSKDRQRIDLYVNGVFAASAAHTGGFDATGGVQFGRSRWADNPDAEAFTGAIDDVSLYTRALAAGEIQTMAGRDVSLGHDWTFDEGKGTRGGDSVGAKPATLAAGATFAPGRVGNALDLPGTGAYATTSGVDVRTDSSFTVSAWVNLKDNPCDIDTTPRCFLSAVSLDGGNTTSKFRLGHVVDDSGHDGNWIFEVPEEGGSVTKASLEVMQGELRSWVHLTGVYDAPGKTIWLYVDGTRKEPGTLLKPWQGTGGLQVGRSKTAGEWGGYWRGGVDDVRLYSGALTADRVSALWRSYPAAAPAPLPVADAGNWKFDENTGTTAADSSGRGKTATLSPGAGWHTGRNAYTGWFDGKTGFAQTAGPVVVDTTESFSVSAWVYNLDNSRYTTVFGQDGDRYSAFHVQYDPTVKKWAAVVGAGGDLKSVLSTEAAYTDGWTHLTLVYQRAGGQLKLYVNGALSGAMTGITVPLANGKFSIGRCRWDGADQCFFKGGIEDVRAYGGKALSDAEVRTVHDDIPPASHGRWRFDDGTVKDTSWVGNPTTLAGTASYPAGQSGKALQLDGASAATAGNVGVVMRDSFTVAAWAKLTRDDKVATVVGQDGARHSGFVLQYRPEVGRWIFGAPTADDATADYHPLTYANSTQAPAFGIWTHLTGVYDYPARQLRLYVNGELVGSKDNVLLWTAWGGLTIGRDLELGAPGGFFTGAIDEVTTDEGVAPDDEIRARAGWPPAAGGQLGRFTAPGDHRTVAPTGGIRDRFGASPAGYRFETPLGRTLPAGTAGTHPMFSCLINNVDAFTSIDPNCEGATKLGELGSSYLDPPAGMTTMPVYRCLFNGERFDSNDPACEGQKVDGLLGYLPAYAPLVRYFLPGVTEHATVADDAPPGYRFEGSLGLLARTNQPGTQVLMSCVDGSDWFVSTDPACDGKTVQHLAGYLWTQPPADRPNVRIYQCALNTGPSAGELFVSSSAACEGQTVRGPLGYLLTA
jgi:hypothetical protein